MKNVISFVSMYVLLMSCRSMTGLWRVSCCLMLLLLSVPLRRADFLVSSDALITRMYMSSLTLAGTQTVRSLAATTAL